MADIYQVLNSYHLMEGLDSEFLVIANSTEHAKEVCLALLTEDQDKHIVKIKQTMADLEKSLHKWDNVPCDEAHAAIYERVNQGNRQSLMRYQNLLSQFNGYKKECLTVNRISPRLKNGQIQFLDPN